MQHLHFHTLKQKQRLQLIAQTQGALKGYGLLHDHKGYLAQRVANPAEYPNPAPIDCSS